MGQIMGRLIPRPASTMTVEESKGESSKSRRRRVSRSTRAQLIFPVSRVHRHLREGAYAKSLASCMPVFLAGILEYLTANILDLAEAKNKEKKRISLKHLESAMQNDQLRPLFEAFTKSVQ